MITRTRCPYCGKVAEQSDVPFTGPGADRQTCSDPEREAEARAAARAATTPSPAPNKSAEGLTVRGYRQGISGSAIHSSVLSNNEIPPLKKLQPSYDTPTRPVSPMSIDGFNDPRARRDYAPGGSAFDEPNPNRSNGKA